MVPGPSAAVPRWDRRALCDLAADQPAGAGHALLYPRRLQHRNSRGAGRRPFPAAPLRDHGCTAAALVDPAAPGSLGRSRRGVGSAADLFTHCHPHCTSYKCQYGDSD